MLDNLQKEQTNLKVMTVSDKKTILETYKWIKVKRYVDDESLS